MELLGTHKISFETIRRLAIECYALSSAAGTLLRQSEYDDRYGLTVNTYEELLSEKLLQLAISIRTRLHQGDDHRRTSGFMEDSGMFLKWTHPTGADERQCPYTLKDVCDKIIHAKQLVLVLDSDLDVSFVELRGDLTVAKESQQWMLQLALPVVCEGILGWIDAIAEA